MSYQLDFTGTEINKMCKTQIHTPWHDVCDCLLNSTNVVANTVYTFTSDGLARNITNPTNDQELWDINTNKVDVSWEQDSPVYVAEVRFNFTPATANAGTIEVDAYIDYPGEPILLRTLLEPYKNESTDINALFAFYVGPELKQYGVYFKYKSSGNGVVTKNSVLVYRT